MKKIFGFWIFLTIIIGNETVKQIKQIYSWNSITVKTVITVWNGITVITVIAVITVITAITCNSRADTTAITWNGITAKQNHRTTAEQFITVKHLIQS